MRVVVIGAGAVGSFLGATLAVAGHDVTLLGRQVPGPGVTADLVFEEADGTRTTVAVRRTHDAATIDRPDLVIAAVKMFDLGAALRTAEAWPDVPLMTVQNGVGAEALAGAARHSPILGGSLTSAVEVIAGGVRRLRTGGMGIAVVREVGVEASATGAAGPTAAAMSARLAASWTMAGLPARVYPDADAMKWSKLLANLVGNATSAILDLDPAQVYADPRGFAIERRQLREAVDVMRMLGLRPVTLPGADVSMLLRGLALPAAIGRRLVARGIAGARGGKSPSLRLHVRGGGTGATEARWLNGAVAEAGSGSGAATPVNACLAALVDEVALDPARAAWFARRIDRLADALAAAERPAPSTS